MVLLRPPRYGSAARPTICVVLTGLPATVALGNASGGLAKAHGLYQCVRVRVDVAQVAELLLESGEPPGANGSRIKMAFAVPPFGPALPRSVPTVNGKPVWAVNCISSAHPPTRAFRTPPRVKNFFPL